MIVIYYGVRPRVTGQSPCADAASEDWFLKQLWQLGLCRAVASVPAMSSSQTLFLSFCQALGRKNQFLHLFFYGHWRLKVKTRF